MINQVGGGFSASYTLTRVVSLQATYGRRFTSGDRKDLQMIRVKIIVVF